VSLVAGILLIALGVREYRHGHAHSHGGSSRGGHSASHDHSHDADQHSHSDPHPHNDQHSHDDHHSDHSHDVQDDASERGLFGIAWFAFLLGFAHEEEFEIIALCAGSSYCLELMSAYAITVIAGIVGLTMALIAGYERFEAEIEQYAQYLPVFSAAVLVVMGLGFVTGVF
jgi:hypothetical protein